MLLKILTTLYVCCIYALALYVLQWEGKYLSTAIHAQHNSFKIKIINLDNCLFDETTLCKSRRHGGILPEGAGGTGGLYAEGAGGTGG